MTAFDNAESDYLNSYKDRKDRMNEQFELRVQELFTELLDSPYAINDAVQNGCGEDQMFGVQLLQYKENHEETHNLIWAYVKQYLLDEAERLAEND